MFRKKRWLASTTRAAGRYRAIAAINNTSFTQHKGLLQRSWISLCPRVEWRLDVIAMHTSTRRHSRTGAPIGAVWCDHRYEHDRNQRTPWNSGKRSSGKLRTKTKLKIRANELDDLIELQKTPRITIREKQRSKSWIRQPPLSPGSPLAHGSCATPPNVSYILSTWSSTLWQGLQ